MITHNILVTGCGGDIGQSILKLLKSEAPAITLVGTDIHDHHPGKFLCDHYYQVPRAADPAYTDTLNQIIERHRISLCIPISEVELRLHAQTGLLDKLRGAAIICADINTMRTGFDKYATARFLQQHGLPHPVTSLVADDQEPVFPVILKDRFGSGSKTLAHAENREEYHWHTRNNKDLLVQEMIPDDEGEFTCGLFRHEDVLRTIIYRRTLLGGYSNYGIKVNNAAIQSFLEQLAAVLKPSGSINIQLRMNKGIPYLFEINPRFSSTVLFRHKMGFKDVIWSIFAATGMPLPGYEEAPEGSEFFKGYEEYISIP